jgi:hypothetical protein
MRTPTQGSGNIFCALIVAVCALIYIRTSVVQPIPKLAGPSDFYAYFHAAEDILRGISPYNDSVFFYPPLLAFLMVPLALVDYAEACWIWFILSHIFLIGAGALLWRGMGGGRIALCCIASVWALGGAINETLRQGQLSPPFGPVAGDRIYAARTRGRSFRRPWLCIEVFPGNYHAASSARPPLARAGRFDSCCVGGSVASVAVHLGVFRRSESARECYLLDGHSVNV